MTSYYREEISPVWDDIVGILSAQTVLEEVKEEIGRRVTRPLEEDYIDEDAFDQAPSKSRTVHIHGVEVEITKLHRKSLKSTDIKGADLLYEIDGEKFVLIQYKTPNTQQRVFKDGQQLETLMACCQAPCPPHYLGFNLICGSWIAIRDQGTSYYLPACKALLTFKSANSKYAKDFHCGVSKQTFEELFAKCWIGSRVAANRALMHANQLYGKNRILFFVRQLGAFRE